MKNRITLNIILVAFLAILSSCAKDGVDGMNGTDGTAGTNGTEGGVTYLVLSGDITDAEAATKIQNDFGVYTQAILVKNTTQLTTLDFSGVSELVELEIQENAQLTSVNFPDLSVVHKDIKISYNTANISFTAPLLTSAESIIVDLNTNLSTLSLVALGKVEYMRISHNDMLDMLDLSGLKTINNSLYISDNNSLSSLNISFLEKVGRFSVQNNLALQSLDLLKLTLSDSFSIDNNEALASISAPLLETTGYFNLDDNIAMTSITFESLVSTGNAYIVGSELLKTVSFPKLTTVDGFNIYNSSSTSPLILTSLNLGSISNFNRMDIYNCKIPALDVDTLLAQLVSINPIITGKNITLAVDGGRAMLSAQSETNITTLESNDNRVWIN